MLRTAKRQDVFKKGAYDKFLENKEGNRNENVFVK